MSLLFTILVGTINVCFAHSIYLYLVKVNIGWKLGPSVNYLTLVMNVKSIEIKVLTIQKYLCYKPFECLKFRTYSERQGSGLPFWGVHA